MDSSFNLAVHALVCLSHSGRSLSSEALAENICTNPTRVRRVMAGLKKAGMVETREGLDGGYRLTADPATLTLRQVAEAINTRFVDCAWHSGDIDRDCTTCSAVGCCCSSVTAANISSAYFGILRPSKIRTILVLVFHYTHIRPVVNSYGELPLKKLTKKLDMPNCICYSYSINCAFHKHRLSQEG